MANYKPVKLMFDLDDEYQAKLYNHLKNRTNGSSYIRTLIHQDIYSAVKDNTIVEQPKPDVIDSIMKVPSVSKVAQPYIKINVNNIPIDEEVYFDDLI